jgi:hypothetical protein
MINQGARLRVPAARDQGSHGLLTVDDVRKVLLIETLQLKPTARPHKQLQEGLSGMVITQLQLGQACDHKHLPLNRLPVVMTVNGDMPASPLIVFARF